MKNLLLLIIVLALPACGFSPMYANTNTQNTSANNNAVKSSLSNIDINIIPNREGQFLRNLLIDRFYLNGYPAAPNYQLKISQLRQNIVDFDVTLTAEATRRQLKLNTLMRLVDTNTNKIVLQRPLTAITSYNVLESEYSTVVTEQSAREAALGDLARQIEQQIVLYLNRL